MSAFIEAPREAMDRIIAGQETLRQLVDNRWLSILRIDTHGKVYERRTQGRWEAA